MRNLASAAVATATASQLEVVALFVLLALVALALVLDGRWDLRLPPAPRLPIIFGASPVQATAPQGAPLRADAVPDTVVGAAQPVLLSAPSRRGTTLGLSVLSEAERADMHLLATSYGQQRQRRQKQPERRVLVAARNGFAAWVQKQKQQKLQQPEPLRLQVEDTVFEDEQVTISSCSAACVLG